MVRYIMSFSVPEGRQRTAQQIIDDYFDALIKGGPAGMRSQCYADNDNHCLFHHIKSFKKEAVANQHFKSGIYRDYISRLAALSGTRLSFSRLLQQQTFESIY